MIKKFDSAGRIVIPMGIRKQLGLEKVGSEVNIEIKNNKITLTNTKKNNIEEYIQQMIEKCEDARTKLIYAEILNKINENK